MQFPIIYLHIPKTAGTSFRRSAEQYFGPRQVLNDYGEKSPNTSEDIRTAVYSNTDLNALREAGLKKNFLTGHFILAKYREIFPDSPVVSFFRDPVDRVISEYFHFSSHYGFEGNLKDFYSKPHFQNRQSRSMSGAMPTELDFFGITERYEESLQLFNRRYGTKFPMAKLNTGRYSCGTRELASAQDIEQIKLLNQKDIELYECALQTFSAQRSRSGISMPTARRYSGNLGGMRDDEIYGWMVDRESESPATIRVAVNGEIRHTQIASLYREDLMRQGVHVDGTCGFRVPLEKLGGIKPGDRISVQTDDGKYEAANSPLIVSTRAA